MKTIARRFPITAVYRGVGANRTGYWATGLAIVAVLYLYSNIGFVLVDQWNFSFRPSYFYGLVFVSASVMAVTSPRAIHALRRHFGFVITLLVYATIIAIDALFTPINDIENQVIISNL